MFATCRVCAFLPELGVLVVGCGWRDGNRLAALPVVGLSEGFGAGTAGFCVGTLGRLPTGRGEVTVTGGGGAAAAFAGGVAGAGAAGGGGVLFGVAWGGGAVWVRGLVAGWVCRLAAVGVRELVGVGVGVGVGEPVEVVGPAGAEA